MVRSIQVMGAALLALALAAPAADAQTAQTALTPTIHARAKHHARKKPEPEGRQITVHKATPSWLTLGPDAPAEVGAGNNYVLDTFAQPTPIQGTFLQGRTSVLDNRFDGPAVPLLRF
jgi:hypothetical protein